MAIPEMARLMALYDETHGIALNEIWPEPVAADPETRRAFWRVVWRELRFHEDEPVGSSRMLEVAWTLAGSGGSPREALLALFEVVAVSSPLTRSYEALLKSLWIPAHCNRERFADAFDFLVPVPRELTPRQAYLILRFTFDCNRYDRAELEQLHALLGGPTYEGIERWLDLAERR